jgi:mRNA-degrading endonuclease toxin of MazEF toxin-antitoxin module
VVTISRGDVVLYDLNPVVGTEQRGICAELIAER